MCGISGFLHLIPSPIPEQTLFNAFMKIKHRGPDYSNFSSFATHALGFHRLAINDLSLIGNQPFVYHFPVNCNMARTIYLMCNGEIYNSEKLKTLYPSNYKYVSTSDCEILLACFLEFNNLEEFIRDVEGEFAISVFDVVKNVETGETTVELHLARDRFGIRPMFYTLYKNDEDQMTNGVALPKGVVSYGFSSEVKGLQLDNPDFFGYMHVFPPRTVTKIIVNKAGDKFVFENQCYYDLLNRVPRLKPKVDIPDTYDVTEGVDEEYLGDDFRVACGKIRSILLDTVTEYLQSDREIGCLLSGGLDSSLISSIASTILQKTKGRKLHTFSIGMPDSPDVIHANIVANHIGSIHTNVVVDESTWISMMEQIVQITETYDITTIRATIGQHLVAKWIKENTNIKVLLVGDGSDELFGGYLYFHKAETEHEFHNECVRRLLDIHYFDVLRTDRGIASNGLEARVPFLNHKLVNYVLSISLVFRMPKYNKGIEKYILRKAFENTNLLPDCILWRPKVAFSDGVSKKEKSAFVLIQEEIEKMVTDEEYEKYVKHVYGNLKPYTKESMYYHKIFTNNFGMSNVGLLKYYWLPKWCGNVTDPSARLLENNNEK
jgi:asparagine synthase (glutamine-hydrolysing)